MHNYNISNVLIDCVEIDENDQEYLYHAAISNYFYQDHICLLLNDIKEKMNNNDGKLLSLFNRYKANENKEFKDFLLNSVYKMEYLNKEISDDSYNIVEIKELADKARLALEELNIIYSQNKEEIDGDFEDCHLCGSMFGAISIAFFLAMGKDNLRIHSAYNIVIALLFPPLHIYEGLKNSPENIMTQVYSEMDVVSELIGQMGVLDVFNEVV